MSVTIWLVFALAVVPLSIAGAQVSPTDSPSLDPAPRKAPAHDTTNGSDNQPGAGSATEEVPTFHSEARMVLVTAGVWKRTADKHPDESLVPPDLLKSVPPIFLVPHLRYAKRLDTRLTESDFHVFDNGTEQTITYFKKTVLPLKDVTREFETSWIFYPTIRGIWGIPPGYFSPLTVHVGGDVPSATWTMKRHDYSIPDITYAIGYVPPVIEPGKCHDVRVEVANHDVGLDRHKYCNAPASQTFGESLVSTDDADDATMRHLADSDVNGSIKISAHATAFWSSRVSYFPAAQNPTGGSNSQPSLDVIFPIEVRDFKASARVHFGIEFVPPGKGWIANCQKNPALHIYGIAYNADHQLAGQFRANFKCYPSELEEKRVAIVTDGSKEYRFPGRFDAQIDLGPGDYELRVVVSDGGKEFGRARVPLHVERLDGRQLAISDVVLSSFPRDAAKVSDEAVAVSPAQLVPAPLISKNVEFLPDTETRLSQHMRLPIYFEIYQPVLTQQKTEVYMHLRITDLKNNSVVLDSGPIGAANWVLPGTSVIPVGFSLGTQSLDKGNYRLDVQASDGAGRQSAWRQANFSIN